MRRKIKISDSGPIACRFKIAQFKNDNSLTEFKDSNFSSDKWIKEKKQLNKNIKIGAIISLINFVLIMAIILNICVIPVA